MKLWLFFAGMESRDPEEALFYSISTTVAESAFAKARKHGMRGALTLLAEVNIRREQKGLPLISFA